MRKRKREKAVERLVGPGVSCVYTCGAVSLVIQELACVGQGCHHDSQPEQPKKLIHERSAP